MIGLWVEAIDPSLYMNNLDIAKNRKLRNHSKWIFVKRLLWSFATLFFRFSPRIAFGYRTAILRLVGAKIGRHVHIYSSARILFPWNLEVGDWSAIAEDTLVYNWGKIYIGERSTISHRSHLCAGTHDYTDPVLPLLSLDIYIGDQVWICADSFVGAGVIVDDGAVNGARAVLVKGAQAWGVYAGNPARYIKKRVINGEKS